MLQIFIFLYDGRKLTLFKRSSACDHCLGRRVCVFYDRPEKNARLAAVKVGLAGGESRPPRSIKSATSDYFLDGATTAGEGTRQTGAAVPGSGRVFLHQKQRVECASRIGRQGPARFEGRRSRDPAVRPDPSSTDDETSRRLAEVARFFSVVFKGLWRKKKLTRDQLVFVVGSGCGDVPERC